MANVTGRSRGCSTCRRRRVKCDEGRPICQRCERAGRECDGPKEMTFVEGKIIKSRRSQKRSSPLPTRGVEDKISVGDGAAPPSMLTGGDLERYIYYIREHLHPTGLINTALDRIPLSDILEAEVSTEKFGIFHQSIVSFATMFFGVRNHQIEVVKQGTTIHGLALKQLNKALSEPDCHTNDEVFLSVVILALQESFVPTGPKTYLAHMTGLERLLELRGAASLSNPTSFELLKGVQPMILLASLRAGRHSILAREEWKVVLKKHCLPEDSDMQFLLGVLADCSILAAEREDITAQKEPLFVDDSERKVDVRDRSVALLSDLHAWKARWDHNESNAYVEVTTSSSSLQLSAYDHGERLVCPMTYEFRNDSAAIMLMFYNMTLIFVLRILVSLPLDKSDYPLTRSSKRNAFSQDNVDGDYCVAERLAALHICRCVPYYLARHGPLAGRTSPKVHMAVTTAWKSIQDDKSEEGQWMRTMLNEKAGDVIAKGLWV